MQDTFLPRLAGSGAGILNPSSVHTCRGGPPACRPARFPAPVVAGSGGSMWKKRILVLFCFVLILWWDLFRQREKMEEKESKNSCWERLGRFGEERLSRWGGFGTGVGRGAEGPQARVFLGRGFSQLSRKSVISHHGLREPLQTLTSPARLKHTPFRSSSLISLRREKSKNSRRK